MTAWSVSGRTTDVGSRSVLHAILDLLPDAVCLSTTTGRSVHTNTLMRRLTRSASGPSISQAIAEERRVLLASDRAGQVSVTRVVTVDNETYIVRASVVRARQHGSTVDLIFHIVRGLTKATESGLALQTQFGLTTREVEVASLLARGLRNDALARSLGITPFTARRHTERVLAKLGVESRAAAAALLARVSVASGTADIDND